VVESGYLITLFYKGSNGELDAMSLGNGTGHPRGVQTLTRTLTRAGFDPKHPGSKHKKTRKTVKKRVF
jgi:hypothetical protein